MRVTEIADARVRLRDQLVLYTADALIPERVHLYTPSIVASPCIWIGQPGVDMVPVGSATVRAVTFRVFIVADGYTEPECAMLDELVARVSDAVYNLARSTDEGARPQPIDIGGTTSRAVAYDVSMTVFAKSFCPTPPAPVVPFVGAST